MIELDSVISSLRFVFYFPIVLVFQLLLTSFASFLGALLEYFLLTPFTLIYPILLIPLLIVQIGSYPLFIKQAVKKGEVKIFETVKKVFSRGLTIFACYILVTLILLLPLLPLLIYGINFFITGSVDFNFLLVLSLVFIIFEVVILLKLWLVFPIMMLEEKGVADSVKLSWKRSKGKLLSIFLTLVIFTIVIFLPISVVLYLSFLLNLELFNFLSPIFSSLLASTGSSLPTIYYLKSKKRR